MIKNFGLLNYKRHYGDIKENLGLEYILRVCTKYQLSKLNQARTKIWLTLKEKYSRILVLRTLE